MAALDLPRGDRVLCFATDDNRGGHLVASTWALSYGSTAGHSSCAGRGTWSTPASWQPETATLTVTWVDGRRPGQWTFRDQQTLLPETLRERVQASVVLSTRLVLGEGRTGAGRHPAGPGHPRAGAADRPGAARPRRRPRRARAGGGGPGRAQGPGRPAATLTGGGVQHGSSVAPAGSRSGAGPRRRRRPAGKAPAPHGAGFLRPNPLLQLRPPRSPVAQLAEQPTVNRQVTGSSPVGGATFPHISATSPRSRLFPISSAGPLVGALLSTAPWPRSGPPDTGCRPCPSPSVDMISRSIPLADRTCPVAPSAPVPEPDGRRFGSVGPRPNGALAHWKRPNCHLRAFWTTSVPPPTKAVCCVPDGDPGGARQRHRQAPPDEALDRPRRARSAPPRCCPARGPRPLATWP